MVRNMTVMLAVLLSAGLAQWTPEGGGDHGGSDWTPTAGQNISGRHYNVGTFTIPAGQTNNVTPWRNLSDQSGYLVVEATSVSIGSGALLDANGRGYGGGGGGRNNYQQWPGGTGGTGGHGGTGTIVRGARVTTTAAAVAAGRMESAGRGPVWLLGSGSARNATQGWRRRLHES